MKTLKKNNQKSTIDDFNCLYENKVRKKFSVDGLLLSRSDTQIILEDNGRIDI